jgi:hypothetical protein
LARFEAIGAENLVCAVLAALGLVTFAGTASARATHGTFFFQETIGPGPDVSLCTGLTGINTNTVTTAGSYVDTEVLDELRNANNSRSSSSASVSSNGSGSSSSHVRVSLREGSLRGGRGASLRAKQLARKAGRRSRSAPPAARSADRPAPAAVQVRQLSAKRKLAPQTLCALALMPRVREARRRGLGLRPEFWLQGQWRPSYSQFVMRVASCRRIDLLSRSRP